MKRQQGFTLVELVVVIVIGAVIAATLAVFFKPAFDSWLAVRVRADLGDQAATALRVMQRDVRLAVPNSIRAPNTSCFELVPTSAGGRFRKAADTVNDASCSGASCSMPLDLSTSTTQFDVLSPLSSVPAAGDWIVVDNQNPGDVYAGTNRAVVVSVSTPSASLGRHRITIGSTPAVSGYDGGRFLVVPNAQQAVFFICSGAGESAGNGTGTLTRLTRSFVSAYPGACPATTGGATLATNVKSCRFLYDPGQGATQQSGFVSMQLELERNNETVSLLLGTHVANVP